MYSIVLEHVIKVDFIKTPTAKSTSTVAPVDTHSNQQIKKVKKRTQEHCDVLSATHPVRQVPYSEQPFMFMISFSLKK